MWLLKQVGQLVRTSSPSLCIGGAIISSSLTLNTSNMSAELLGWSCARRLSSASALFTSSGKAPLQSRYARTLRSEGRHSNSKPRLLSQVNSYNALTGTVNQRAWRFGITATGAVLLYCCSPRPLLWNWNQIP